MGNNNHRQVHRDLVHALEHLESLEVTIRLTVNLVKHALEREAGQKRKDDNK